MAGSRRESQRPRRPAARIERFTKALDAAATVEAQLAIAFDWWRIAFRGHAGPIQQLAADLAGQALQQDRRAS